MTKTLYADLNECFNAITVKAQVYLTTDIQDINFSFKINALSSMLDGNVLENLSECL